MRLIDADALIKEFDPNGERLDPILVRSRIVQQPTAYNPEKVVEELEEMKNDRDCQTYCYEFYKKKCKNYDRAIDIVRRGGVK